MVEALADDEHGNPDAEPAMAGRRLFPSEAR